ncbi:MAG: hypothetical protein ACYDH9_04025 [Limisphaerales bacterium]
MRFPTKKELGGRLAGYPLLRLLLFQFWFRLAFLGFVLLLVFLALFLPRIWRVTPRGFLPEVNISGLDWLQARSLKRTALRAETQGRIDEALFAWQTAIAYHPGDPELFRGSLRTMLRSQRLPPDLSPVLGQAAWLLRLAGTNQADFDLAARVYEKLRLDNWTLDLLGSRNGVPDPRSEALRLKALFNAGKTKQFIDDCRRCNRLPRDPELELYLAACSAGWEPIEKMADADQTLETALGDPTRRVVAARLQLRVAAHLGDLPRYERVFKLLQAWQADAVPDHVTHWQLLVSLGRKAEALHLAANCPRAPQTAIETARLAEALARLGLRSEAGGLFDKYANLLIPAEPIWLTQANLLIENRQWEEARALALRIRLQPAVCASLASYSYYLEGRADLAEDRPASAETAFQQCAASECNNPALGLFIAAELDQLGYTAFARDILLKSQKRLATDPGYWRLLFSVAWKLKDSDLVLAAATADYRLRPADATAMNNYAAALLLCRQQPEQALVLTLQLIGRNPDSVTAKVNHSLALLLNHRAAEADAMLQTINPQTLAGVAATVHAWARFEACVELKKFDEATLNSQRIDPRYLFPVQGQWLEQQRRRLPHPAATKS